MKVFSTKVFFDSMRREYTCLWAEKLEERLFEKYVGFPNWEIICDGMSKEEMQNRGYHCPSVWTVEDSEFERFDKEKYIVDSFQFLAMEYRKLWYILYKVQEVMEGIDYEEKPIY